jgi:hypothetical protein
MHRTRVGGLMSTRIKKPSFQGRLFCFAVALNITFNLRYTSGNFDD